MPKNLSLNFRYRFFFLQIAHATTPPPPALLFDYILYYDFVLLLPLIIFLTWSKRLSNIVCDTRLFLIDKTITVYMLRITRLRLQGMFWIIMLGFYTDFFFLHHLKHQNLWTCGLRNLRVFWAIYVWAS